mgnify:CR=1 FL=1
MLITLHWYSSQSLETNLVDKKFTYAVQNCNNTNYFIKVDLVKSKKEKTDPLFSYIDLRQTNRSEYNKNEALISELKSDQNQPNTDDLIKAELLMEESTNYYDQAKENLQNMQKLLQRLKRTYYCLGIIKTTNNIN